MIKIPLSYKIIKKRDILDSQRTISLSKTNFTIVNSYEEVKNGAIEEFAHEDGEVEVDLEELEKEIHNELALEIQEEKNQILNEARVEGDKIRLESRKQGYKLGYKEGHTQGYEEGIIEAKDEGQEIKANALDLLDQSESYVEEYLEINKTKIIQLAVDIAESIVHNAIEMSTEDILLLIRPILENYEKKDNIIITCNPKNYPHLREGIEGIKRSFPESRFILLKDANLEKNGCIIENEHQVMDLQIKKQIQAVLKEIKSLG